MNYLAHAYLSFGHSQVLAGNMISDFVKGRRKFDFPPLVQAGIMLHRHIDTFTDAHAATAEAKKYFKQAAGLYAGAFVDIVYDHFLALDGTQHSEAGWLQFCTQTYASLQQQPTVLHEKFARMLPAMQSQNWLFNYRYHWGIENSFRGLVHRAAYLDDYKPAFHAFETHYAALQQCYTAFFPAVKAHALALFQQIG